MNSYSIGIKDRLCSGTLPSKRYSVMDTQDLQKRVCIDLTESNLERKRKKEVSVKHRFEVTHWFEADSYYDRLLEIRIPKTPDKENEKSHKDVLSIPTHQTHKTSQESTLSSIFSSLTSRITNSLSTPSKNSHKMLPKTALILDPEPIDLELDQQFHLLNQHLHNSPSVISLLDEEVSPTDSQAHTQISVPVPVPAPAPKSIFGSVIYLDSDFNAKPVATSKEDLMEMRCITEMAKQYFKLNSLDIKQINSFNNGHYTSSVYMNNRLISFTESSSSNRARAKAVLIAINSKDPEFCEEWLERNEQYMKSFLGVTD